MEFVPRNQQRERFPVGQTDDKMTSKMKAETVHGKEINNASQGIPWIQTGTDTSTSHIAIVCPKGEPMILSTIDKRSSSSNSSAVSSLSQCSNYTLDTDASRLTTYSATTTGCDSTVYATPLSYCSKIDMI
ncbi:unnamed protein product [Rotaria magnacalcarata]|uniref:Uncharacterized protein n=1 Tax=Rotaria magnacalcarata TaxID=392030 RepID=A0A819X4L8_9BILA|nr:unnamed protein product [Rotaria magnacalcarata]